MSIFSKLGIVVLLVPWLIMLMSLFVANVQASPTAWTIETVDASLDVGGSSSMSSDTTPPTISILSPEDGTYTANDVSLTFTVSEPASWICYSLDCQENQTITGNTTLPELAEVIHSIVVYAEDPSGNVGASEIVRFSVGVQEPEPFPTWTVVAIVIVAGASATVLVYFTKIKKPTGKGK